jgi:disulfide bond formation protein DsbB
MPPSHFSMSASNKNGGRAFPPALSLLMPTSQELLDAILNANMVPCDEPQWTLLGISMAGFNFLIALSLAVG